MHHSPAKALYQQEGDCLLLYCMAESKGWLLKGNLAALRDLTCLLVGISPASLFNLVWYGENTDDVDVMIWESFQFPPRKQVETRCFSVHRKYYRAHGWCFQEHSCARVSLTPNSKTT